MPLAARFDLAPAEALKFFRAKGFKLGFAWQDVWHEEHDAAFTVAKMMDVDLLRDVRAGVDRALAEGRTFSQFKGELQPLLEDAGWWGKKAVVDPQTGETVLAQLGSPRRLRTIFRVNLQTAYSAGAWERIQDTKADAPYLMYDAVDDNRTRPEHRAWDGKVLRADDGWWRTHMPPNGWNCRCSVIQLSRDQVEAMGKTVEGAQPVAEREYTNPRTGEVSRVPVGIDPGWAYNPGRDRLAHLQRAYDSKLKEYRDGR